MACVDEGSRLFAVKYRRAVSLIDVEGDMKGNWRSRGDLADVAVMPAQGAISMKTFFLQLKSRYVFILSMYSDQ